MQTVEVKSPTNIALVKYWGKHPKYERLLIPTKSSLSFTVAGLTTTTKLTVEPGSLEIDFSLNGKHISQSQAEFDYVKEFFDKISVCYPLTKEYRYTIASRNDFPTASGFASSAAGFSALALAFAHAMTRLGRLAPMDEAKLSVLARLGSGSAARSVPSRGGLVLWHRGYDEVTSDTEASEKSYAETLFEPSYFDELALIYVKVESHKEKETKSRAGMKESVGSVYDYWNWVEYEERHLLPAILGSIKARKWSQMFSLTKQASNNFHSVCVRTVPPIFYLTDGSLAIIRALQPLDDAAYTFDAGPNAVVLCLKQGADRVEDLLKGIVGSENTFRTYVGEGPKVGSED